jgi:hypothetical protein
MRNQFFMGVRITNYHDCSKRTPQIPSTFQTD